MLNILGGAALAGLAIVAIAVWARMVPRWWRGQPLLDFQPRQDVAWDFLDVVATIVLLFASNILLMTVLNYRFGITDAASFDDAPLRYHLESVWYASLASLVTLSGSAALIGLRHRLSFRDLGFVPDRPGRDVWLGCGAFLVLAPPTYAVQAVLVQWFKSRHPIVELIRENPDPWLIGASVFSAVIVAPVFEEYLFRGLLQGWLERLAWSTDLPHLHGVGQDNNEDRTSRLIPEPLRIENGYLIDDRACAPEQIKGPQVPSGVDMRNSDTVPVSRIARPQGIIGIFPILVSSTLFAALHVAHGPDWIPLLLLALGLGYLYRQTHRLLPCIIVHVLLNGCSMGMFLVELLR